MPNNTRGDAKRRLEEAVSHLDWTLHHLKWIQETYATVSYVKDPTETVIALIIACEEAIQKIKDSF